MVRGIQSIYIRLTTRGVLYSETIFMQTMLIYLRELLGFSGIEKLHAIHIKTQSLYNMSNIKFHTLHSSFQVDFCTFMILYTVLYVLANKKPFQIFVIVK